MQNDIATLKKLIKIAARSSNIKEFLEKTK